MEVFFEIKIERARSGAGRQVQHAAVAGRFNENPELCRDLQSAFGIDCAGIRIGENHAQDECPTSWERCGESTTVPHFLQAHFCAPFKKNLVSIKAHGSLALRVPDGLTGGGSPAYTSQARDRAWPRTTSIPITGEPGGGCCRTPSGRPTMGGHATAAAGGGAIGRRPAAGLVKGAGACRRSSPVG
jgi:hypothetical protein